jgi:bifunctional non-homologous end joining protein LigD
MEGARDLRAILVELGLASYVKTSGGKGLHVVVPLTRRGNWDEVKNFSGAVAKRLAEREPKRYTASMAKWAREGRIFVDFLRNVRGATCVAAFSTRARPGAAVSAPLHWDELDAHPIVYTVMTLPRRLASLREDPWAGFFECRQSITKAMVKAVRSA